jgi:flagella basal body P-ring formation protein FlgA
MTAAERLQLYLDAERAILAGQMVQMGDKRLTRADLAVVQSEIARLERRVQSEKLRGAGIGAIGFSVARLD